MQLKAGIFLALLVATLLLVALYTKSLTKGSQQQIVSLFPSKTKAGDTDSSAQGEKVSEIILLLIITSIWRIIIIIDIIIIILIDIIIFS